MIEILLDVRTLEHPVPFEKAITAVNSLERGSFVRMVHRREPFPLYEELDRRGLNHKTKQKGEALYEIYIWLPEDFNPMDE